ncbi:MAG: PrsW family intramembrane metalloprotease [Pseudomonadota bacterium]
MIILILLFFSVFLATLPMICLLLVVWWLDRYEREPLWLVGLVFAWGAVGGVLLGGIFSLAFTMPIHMVFGAQTAEIAGAVLIAPIIEEITKGAVLLLIVFNRNFDNATDGFIYGAATGLGFGMVENLLYFSLGAASGDVPGWCGIVFMRTIFTAPMHALASSCFGATLGYAKFQRSGAVRVVIPMLGLGIAMAIHFLWNSFAVASGAFSSEIPLLLSILIIIGEFTLIFAVFQASLFSESRMIRRELEKEARAGLIPALHLKYLPYYFKRFQGGWLQPGVSKRRYIARATELAFRRAQRDRCGPDRRAFYASEVSRLQQEVRQILEGARGPSPAHPLPPGPQAGGPGQVR